MFKAIRNLLSPTSEVKETSVPEAKEQEVPGAPDLRKEDMQAFNAQKPGEELLNRIFLQCIHDRASSFKIEMPHEKPPEMYFQINGQWHEMQPQSKEVMSELTQVLREMLGASADEQGEFESDNTIEGLGCVIKELSLKIKADEMSETLQLSFEIAEQSADSK